MSTFRATLSFSMPVTYLWSYKMLEPRLIGVYIDFICINHQTHTEVSLYLQWLLNLLNYLVIEL